MLRHRPFASGSPLANQLPPRSSAGLHPCRKQLRYSSPPALLAGPPGALLPAPLGRRAEVRPHAARRGPKQAASTDGDIFLNEEQGKAVFAARRGRNVFVTGCAGTGKSVVMREIQQMLLQKHGQHNYHRRVKVTAPTGVAANNIGGQTLHSLLRLHKIETYGAFRPLLEDAALQDELLWLDTLIIDELGMVSAELLQALDNAITIARKAAAKRRAEKEAARARTELTKAELDRALRPYDKPFGGVQIIASGDFSQLGPVERLDTGRKNPHLPRERHFFANRGYAFQAPAWQYARFKTVELTQVYRQADEWFQRQLQDIRCGGAAAAARALGELTRLCRRPLDESNGIKATRLFAVNKSVDTMNNEELGKLDVPEHAFLHVTGTKVLRPAPVEVYRPLVDEGLVAAALFEEWREKWGSHKKREAAVAAKKPRKAKASAAAAAARGQAAEAAEDGGLPAELQKLAPTVQQRVEALAWAWKKEAWEELEKEVHRLKLRQKRPEAPPELRLRVGAQVMLTRNLTSPRRKAAPSDADAPAGSPLDGLVNGSRGVVTGFVPFDEALQMLKQVAPATRVDGEHCRRWVVENKGAPIPVVRFAPLKKGGKDICIPVPPVEFERMLSVHQGRHAGAYGVYTSVQVPLCLAWAMTVHKCQGMGLDKAVVDFGSQGTHGKMGDFFAPGQVYTVLSRARGIEGLQIKGDAAVMVDEEVLLWAADPAGYVNGVRHADPVWCWEDGEHPWLSEGQSAAARGWLQRARRGLRQAAGGGDGGTG